MIKFNVFYEDENKTKKTSVVTINEEDLVLIAWTKIEEFTHITSVNLIHECKDCEEKDIIIESLAGDVEMYKDKECDQCEELSDEIYQLENDISKLNDVSRKYNILLKRTASNL